MAPSSVLLERCLFVDHVPTGETEGGRDSIGCASEERKGRPSDEEYRDAITDYLRSLKPDPLLADPPELSSFRMLHPAKSTPPLCRHVTSAFISSADKHLVAIYAGYYRPGNSSRGCYLIYDARNNSLSTIPQIPFNNFHDNMGDYTAVVVCDVDGAGYTLAELVRVGSSDVAELYLWRPSTGEWAVEAGRLPFEVRTPYDSFSASICFHYRGTSLCWVDLLNGILVCDLSEVQRHGYPKFRFVPLPEGCATYDPLDDYGRVPCVDLYRSMACVGGVITFLTIDGYLEHLLTGLKLRVWTLSSDLSRWDISKEYDVENIWANETYKSSGLRKMPPSFPVLSMHEANVVYLVCTDLIRQSVTQTMFSGQYVLRVDMGKSEVQIGEARLGDMIIHSPLFISDFSAYRQGLEDHQRQVDGS